MAAEEGVIKFACNWTNAPFESPIDLSSLIKVRNELWKLRLIGASSDNVGYGNVSVFSAQKEFIISGTQTGSLSQFTENEFSIVTDYNIQMNTLSCTGLVKASSESLTHAALYDCSGDIKSVLHVHSMPLWQKFKDVLPTTSPEAEYGTIQMAESVGKVAQSNSNTKERVIILGGHPEGIIAYGKDPEDALMAIKELL